MKFLILGLLLISSVSSFANEYIRGNEISTCKVRIDPLGYRAQHGLIYSHTDSINANLLVYGPKDLSKTCKDTTQVVIKRIPVRISASHAIGATFSAVAIRSGSIISVNRWNGNSLQDIIGNYTGLQAGVDFWLGFSLNTMIKTDFASVVTLSTANWESFGIKVDLSLVNFSIKKITSNKTKNKDWDLVLRKHE